MLNKQSVIKMIVGIAVVGILSGCSNELENQNKFFKTELIKLKLTNKQILNALQASKTENISLKKEIKVLRVNNKDLDVALAKSELLFSQKYKKRLENEQQKLEDARELFKEEKKKIEQKAHEKANKDAALKYETIIGSLSLIFVVILVLAYYSFRKERENSKKLEDSNSKLKNDNEENEGTIQVLSKEIDKLKQIQQSSTLSSVINKIEEHESKRVQMLNRIERV